MSYSYLTEEPYFYQSLKITIYRNANLPRLLHKNGTTFFKTVRHFFKKYNFLLNLQARKLDALLNINLPLWPFGVGCHSLPFHSRKDRILKSNKKTRMISKLLCSNHSDISLDLILLYQPVYDLLLFNSSQNLRTCSYLNKSSSKSQKPFSSSGSAVFVSSSFFSMLLVLMTN